MWQWGIYVMHYDISLIVIAIFTSSDLTSFKNEYCHIWKVVYWSSTKSVISKCDIRFKSWLHSYIFHCLLSGFSLHSLISLLCLISLWTVCVVIFMLRYCFGSIVLYFYASKEPNWTILKEKRQKDASWDVTGDPFLSCALAFCFPSLPAWRTGVQWWDWNTPSTLRPAANTTESIWPPPPSFPCHLEQFWTPSSGFSGGSVFMTRPSTDVIIAAARLWVSLT